MIFHETGDNYLSVLVNPYWFNLQLGVAIGVTDALTSSSPQLIKLCYIQRLDNSLDLKLTYIPLFTRDCLAGGFG
jgi:hypothetical protein